jgi:hypothetical protein
VLLNTSVSDLQRHISTFNMGADDKVEDIKPEDALEALDALEKEAKEFDKVFNPIFATQNSTSPTPNA